MPSGNYGSNVIRIEGCRFLGYRLSPLQFVSRAARQLPAAASAIAADLPKLTMKEATRENAKGGGGDTEGNRKR